jgi:hypothetical protein
MKIVKTFLALLGMIAWATAYGAIPQLINYQGLLLDDNGSKVTGVKVITLKVFTGATDGNGTKEIYDENVGNVAVTDGLYAFNFGGGGQSVITTTETVGTGDGTAQIFNYTVEHAPVLDGTATITKYVSDTNATEVDSWSQTSGSSNASYIASVVNATGAVAVTNAAGAPASGQHIEVVYDYNSVGIMGALSTNPNAWLQVSVDGSPLLPRQRLVAVPFANVAGTIQGENLSVDPISGNVIVKNDIVDSQGQNYGIGINPIPTNDFSSSSTGLSVNVVYEALTDGFFIGRNTAAYSSTSFSQWFYLANTKANTSSSSYRFYFYDRATHLLPIAKGQFFKFTSSFGFFTGNFRVAP